MTVDPARPAELIVRGRIATLAGDAGFGWVEAIAVSGGRVIAAGPAAEVEPTAGRGTRWLRLADGQVALPGITDAHLHLEDAALAKQALDLHATSLEEGLAAVAREHGSRLVGGDRDGWIVGAGWSVDQWGRWPTAADLESVAPGRAVALWSHDHHSRLASPTALRLAGVGPGTVDPAGGLVGREPGGGLTGVLYEKAATLVDHSIPRPGPELVEAAVIDHARELLALGITGVHDPGELAADPLLRDGPMLYARLASGGRSPLRVHGSIRGVQLERAVQLGLRSGSGTTPVDARDPAARLAADRYRMGWLKLFADGAMGSRTAALLEPYRSEPGMPAPAGGPTGMFTTEPEELRTLTRQATEAGIATQIHAIGDRAVRLALEVLAGAADARLPLMPRVEHVQLLAREDAASFRRDGIAASMQPVHLHSDAGPAQRLWGERTAGAFALRTLLDAGATLAFGTDAPVESPDPWPGIAIAVTRADPTWPPEVGGAFHAEQALTLAEAVRAACAGPGLTAGDARLGRLIPGSPADLIVVDAGALAEPVAAGGPLATTRPLATLIDGAVVHRAPAFDREPEQQAGS